MDELKIESSGPIKRDLTVPGDKSISHRAFMFASLADGTSRLHGVQKGLDVKATRNCVEALGIKIEEDGGDLIVHGKGPDGFSEPEDVLDAMNSGTTMRLMAGILAGQPWLSVMTGDRHLRKRPMARILNPLREMGALALGRNEDNLAPLVIRGGQLRAIDWGMNVASAQVKSAVLLAGLYARGVTWVSEPLKSRDHTERMLASMGVEILTEGDLKVGIRGRQKPRPVEMEVPGDPSSAAFWGGAALMVPGSVVTVRNVALNPTRTGFFALIKRMGADLETLETGTSMGEPVGDVTVRYSKLKGIEITEAEVPAAIDEFPVLAAVAAVADGETLICGAEELRHKESDRIDTVAGELRKAGVAVETFPDGMRITGGSKLNPAVFESHGDHRIAMAFGVLALAVQGGAKVKGGEAAAVSYPDFWRELAGG